MHGSATTSGWTMNWGWFYDFFERVADAVLFRGKLGALRHKAVELADLRPGQAVLDVGCGTGTLALLAKERVGEAGRVTGIDPAGRQIARARTKAARRGTAIDFRVSAIESLPFSDQSFDAVLSTLMMHHLPDDLKRRGLAEIARVLKPGGRLVIVDFKRREGRRGRPGRLGAGEIGIQDEPRIIADAGFSAIATGDLPFPRMPGLAGAGFALATR